MRRLVFFAVLTALAVAWTGAVSASTPGPDVKLTHDANDPGYVSEYTLATGVPYTDATLTECSRSRGRQNEPAVAIDPRDPQVVLGSSNDYCGVYNTTASDGTPLPAGPIWEGYYRSENGGSSYTSSLVPGYPDDNSPYGQLAKQQIRTASAGDPVIAWDAHGRAFFGSESSDDPAGTPKTFGDEWVARFYPATTGAHPDGKRYTGTTVVAKGSSAPNLLGKFNDKTAIEADHNADGRCDDDVYFSWSRFSGNNGGVAIYFVRSTDHGVTFTNPSKVSQTISNLQDPDIAVTGNDDVYVFFRSFASGRGAEGDAIYYVKSTDCGATFTRPSLLTTFVRNDATDSSDPEAAPPQSRPDDPQFGEDDESADAGVSRDCGDFADHCESGYTFFRRDTQDRATADQFDPVHQYVYVVFDATKPGTEVPTGTSYYTVSPGIGGQAAVMFTRLDGSTGTHTTPIPIDNQASGHQVFPDVSADNPAAASRGTVHAFWWDSRNDPCYSAARPIGNCANRSTTNSLDAWGAVSHDFGGTWPTKSRVSDVTTNPNYEQFDDRSVPFAGDYLYISSLNDFSIGTWTDWRNTVQGTDPREAPEDEDATTADVHQCRVFTDGAWSSDLCPRDGGLDQNIYGDLTP